MVILFRVLVMFACLIIVPLAAIFGSQFPDVVKSVLLDRILPPDEKQSEAAFASRSDAPAFEAHGNEASFANDSMRIGSRTAPPNEHAALANAPSWQGAPTAEAPADWNAGGQIRQAAVELGGSNPPNAAQRLDMAAVPNSTGPGPLEVGQPLPQPDQFTWMERRLKQYGATYYLLETLGNDSERYRFFCKMAVPNNPTQTRNFEAMDTDPLRAMGRVVQQVEQWRAGQLP